jgi:precorrin-3B synthase
MAGVTDADRCPGVLRPHLAQDGAVVRIRVPGGETTGAALRLLSGIAQQFGSGDLQLTSRASVQLRGLPDPVPADLIAAVKDAGFLPSEAHERVRNIVISPLTGISGGLADLRPLVVDLDTRLCADPRLASLPPRFLFVVDDGRGDVSGRSFDLGYRAVDHDHGWLLLGGADLGIRIPASHAADMLLAFAQEFLTASRRSGDVWHVRELASWTKSVPGVRTLTLPLQTTDVPLGAVGGAASVHVPLGSLTPAQAATVEACAPGRVILTPSRGLVLPGVAARLPELVAAGLISDESSPWSAISACVGAPSCRKSFIDTRAYATTLAESGHPLPRTHISGCERRCGAPAGAHHDLVASAASPLLLVGESR